MGKFKPGDNITHIMTGGDYIIQGVYESSSLGPCYRILIPWAAQVVKVRVAHIDPKFEIKDVTIQI